MPVGNWSGFWSLRSQFINIKGRVRAIFIKIVVIFAKVHRKHKVMEAFFSFIFFTIVGFYVLGLIGKLLLRYWIRKKQREFSQNFGQGASQGGSTFRQYTWGNGANNPRSSEKPREGEVKIEQTASAKPKKVNKNVGDYVDYEEIKQ